MRAVVLNETSDWHSGSAAATRALKNLLEDAGHHTVGVVGTFAQSLEAACFETLDMAQAELVVIHGEGTFTHSAPRAQAFLNAAMAWKRDSGAQVWLVNTVWQRNGPELAELARYCDRVFAREPDSAAELVRDGVPVDGVFLDLSVLEAGPACELRPEVRPGSVGFGEGVCGTPLPWTPEGAVRISLRGDRVAGTLAHYLPATWASAIYRIRQVELYLTGEHHGVLAAAIAETPWASLAPNTWKLASLLRWADVTVPLATTPAELEQLARWAWTPDGRRQQERFARWIAEDAPRMTPGVLE